MFLTFKFSANIVDRFQSQIQFSDRKHSSIVKKYFDTHWGAHALASYHMVKDNLYFGVGNKNFRYECSKYQKILEKNYDIRAPGCATHPHQIYYELLSEHGLVGTIIIFSVFLYLIFLRLKKNNLNLINYISFAHVLIIFIPILPYGSFFTSKTALLFWLNFVFFMTQFKSNIKCKS